MSDGLPVRPAAAPVTVPTVDDVFEAMTRVQGWVDQTPILTSSYVDALCGRRVFFKAEHLQRTGSYKIRGACNHIRSVWEDGGGSLSGVVAASSGNHGQAVAWVARRLQIPATVVVPPDIRPAKLAALRGYGADVVEADASNGGIYAVARRIAAETGMREIAPYDHPLTIAGQATCAYEALTQQLSEPLAYVMCPIGGGGLASGTALAIDAAQSTAKLVAVEPAGADDTFQSWRAGRRISNSEIDTIADALLAETPGEITFAINKNKLSDVLTVTDVQINSAMRIFWQRMKQVVEPSGAVSLAGALHNLLPDPGPVLLIVSGGNVDIPEAQN